jgi:acyl-coenzyme A thioesterase PaaI-like protein
MSAVSVRQINEFLAREFPNSHRCEDVGERWATAILDASGTSLRPGGIIPGPAVFGVCDAALYYACFTAIGIEPMTLTSELSIRYMRPAKGLVVRARADLHHVGKRSIIGSIVAWTDSIDKPVAVAQGTYVRPT